MDTPVPVPLLVVMVELPAPKVRLPNCSVEGVAVLLAT